MKKQQIILLIIICSLISTLSYQAIASPMEEGFPHFPSSSPSRQTVGSGAAEWETVDTFEVHPDSGRWTESANVGWDSSVISDECLNLTDTGDASLDYISYSRDLRSLDDTITLRFKYAINGTASDSNNFMIFSLDTEAGYGFQFRTDTLDNSSYSPIKLRYYDVDGVLQSKVCTGTEHTHIDTWYRLRMDYDLLRSRFRCRLYFDNGSRVLDYDWYDISSETPRMFEGTTVSVQMRVASKESGLTQSVYISYVQAPFKEREWVQDTIPTDGDWLEDRWDIAYAQDDISEYSKWNYTVPYLDSASISIKLEWENASALITPTDTMQSIVALHAVDALNGTHYEIVRAYMGTDRSAAAVWSNRIFVYNADSSKSYTYAHHWSTGTSLPDCRMYCSFEIQEDRSVIDLKVRFFYDITNDSAYCDFVIEEDVDDWVDNPSQEFVIHVSHRMSFTGNTEGKIVVEKFDPLSHDRFAEVHKGLPEAKEGIQGGAWDPLAELQKGIADAFNKILGPLFQGLYDFVDGLEGLLSSVWDSIANVVTEIQGLAADIASDIWAGIGDALDFITDAIGVIVDEFFAWLWGVAAEMAEFFFDVLELLLPLLLDLAEYVWDIVATVVFFIWDALGLPDLLAIVEVLLTGFIQFVNGIPIFITDMAAAIQALFTLVPVIGLVIFFGFPLAQRDIGGYFEAMLTYMGFDITFGLEVFGNGIYIPAVAVWLVVSLATVLSGTTYAGFF
ncbi:MAG: hypothetical protein ACFFC0_10600 [Promethearchaeota archaeon]